jgi:hypothetical protein
MTEYTRQHRKHEISVLVYAQYEHILQEDWKESRELEIIFSWVMTKILG